jgi:alanine dehydrogenase
MIMGVPKEIKEGEKRVALTPAGVHVLVHDGHSVVVETGAGMGSRLSDEEYILEGATIASKKDLFDKAELILKVKEPLESEWPYLREGKILFTYLHLASSRNLTNGLLRTGITGIAYETVQDKLGNLPLLIPMSEVAGRMAVQLAVHFLEAEYGGRGILLSGVPGVPPAEVVILGCGVTGYNAAKVAEGQGAHVTIIDINYSRLKYADDVLHGKVMTLFSNPYMIKQAVANADVLIGAVLIPGARAPVLVTEEMVSEMKPGSVIIDISVDQGGSIETTRPTSHAEPIYKIHDVIHYAVPNMPASVPLTSTAALTNATLPYIRAIASKGLKKAAEHDPSLAAGINLARGVLTHPAVAESFNMKCVSWKKVV